MKKGLLLVVVMLATIAVKAQDVYVGGSLNVWRNSTGNTTSFKVAPEVGYNFNETWALGAELDYSHNYNGGLTKNSVIVAPYIRWSYCETGAVRLFLDGTAALGFVKVKDGDTTKAGQVLNLLVKIFQLVSITHSNKKKTNQQIRKGSSQK